MAGENETVHSIRVEGTEEAIRKFEALAAAKARAADSGGGGLVAEGNGRSSYWGFSGAPAAPGTAGNPQANVSAVPTPGAIPTPGAVNGNGVSVGSLTVHAANVTIYASSLSYGNAGITAGGSRVSESGASYAVPPGGGAPAAPGTEGAPPPSRGGLFGAVQNFLGRPLNPSAPYSASMGDLLGAGVESGSVGGMVGTLVNSFSKAAPLLFALNSANQIASAQFASYQPSYNVETQRIATEAGGRFVNPAILAGQQASAEIHGTNAYWRQLIGGLGPLAGPVGTIYETLAGRERDREATRIESAAALQARELMAIPLLGRQVSLSEKYGEAQFQLLDAGAMFGRGGAESASRINIGAMIRANGNNQAAATNYAQSLIGFAGRAQWESLDALIAGNLNPMAMEPAFLQSAAESGDFGALSLAQKGGSLRNLKPFFQIAATIARGNADNQIASSGLSYTQAHGALVGALGGSMADRAREMDAGDVYMGRMLGVTEEQLAIARDPLRVAQLTAQREQIRAQRASNRTAAIALRYQGQQSFLQSDLGSYNLDVQQAMFGSDPSAVVEGYQNMGAVNQGLSDLYGRMSKERSFSPEQRAMYANMSRQAQFDATIGMQRQVGGFYLGLAQGDIGIQSAQVGSNIASANLFGGVQDIYRANLGQETIAREQRGLVEKQLAGEYGPITMQERLELQAKLTSLMQQEVTAREGAVRGLAQMQVALAQTAQGMATSQMQRAFIAGAGGVEGFGYAEKVSEAAAGVLRAAENRVAVLRSRGTGGGSVSRQSSVSLGRDSVSLGRDSVRLDGDSDDYDGGHDDAPRRLELSSRAGRHSMGGDSHGGGDDGYSGDSHIGRVGKRLGITSSMSLKAKLDRLHFASQARGAEFAILVREGKTEGWLPEDLDISKASLAGAGGSGGGGAMQYKSPGSRGVQGPPRYNGVAEDNPEMQNAKLEEEKARLAYEQAEMAATQVPFSLGLRREENQTRFAIQALSAFPGQYGSIRNLLGKQMQGQEHQAHEIEARRNAHRAQYGGKLPDHLEFAYEQQLQQVALEQAGTFQQLSYGWESRLTSQMLGTPGSMAFLSPSMSFAAAIGNGVVNPHMGATQEQVPMFLRQASLISSLAGATGTAEGFGVTAMTGANSKLFEGMEITLRVPMPGGGMETIPASMTVKGSNQDTSPAATLEQIGRAGSKVAVQ